MNKADSSRISKILAALLLAIFLAFIYLLTYSGALHNTDERFFYDSVFWNHTGKLFRSGWLFVQLLTPFLKLASILPRTGGFQLALLSNIIFTSITAAILTLFVGDITKHLKISVFTGLVYGVGTLAWPYSHYLFREPLTALIFLILMWLYFLAFRRPRLLIILLTGAVYVLLLLVKFKLTALAPLFLLADLWLLLRWGIESRYGREIAPQLHQRFCILREKLQYASVGTKLLIFLALIVVLNVIAIGMSFIFPFFAPSFIRNGPRLLPFLGSWFSPGWGIFIFVPALWISLAGVSDLVKKHAGFSLLLFSAIIFYFILASEHPVWWGYWAFGPRQFVPFLPLMMLPFPLGWRWLSQRLGAPGIVIGYLLIGLSVAIQIVGVLAPFNRFVFDVYFTKNISGELITWRPDLWPVWGMARYVSPQTVDIAWLRSSGAATYEIHWQVVLPMLAGILVTGWLLWRLLSGKQKQITYFGIASLLIMAFWGVLAVYSVHTVYADERYQPEMGYIEAAAQIREHARPGDLIVTDLWTPELDAPSVALLNYCQGDCPQRVDIIRQELNRKLAQNGDMIMGRQQIWLVLPRIAEGDPNSLLEKRLDQMGFLIACEWTGPQVRLCRYSMPPADLISLEYDLGRFGEHIFLLKATVWRAPAQEDAAIHPGDMLQLDLRWRTDASIHEDDILSIQLIGPDGALVNAFDWRPGNGFRPTTSWQPGEEITDRRALPIPDDAAPGAYTLLAILYNSANGERLAVQTDEKSNLDALPIYVFNVQGSSQ